MDKAVIVILLFVLFGPVALCIAGFVYHPVAGVIAIGVLIINIILFQVGQCEKARCLWGLSGVMAMILEFFIHTVF